MDKFKYLHPRFSMCFDDLVSALGVDTKELKLGRHLKPPKEKCDNRSWSEFIDNLTSDKQIHYRDASEHAEYEEAGHGVAINFAKLVKDPEYSKPYFSDRKPNHSKVHHNDLKSEINDAVSSKRPKRTSRERKLSGNDVSKYPSLAYFCHGSAHILAGNSLNISIVDLSQENQRNRTVERILFCSDDHEKPQVKRKKRKRNNSSGVKHLHADIIDHSGSDYNNPEYVLNMKNGKDSKPKKMYKVKSKKHKQLDPLPEVEVNVKVHHKESEAKHRNRHEDSHQLDEFNDCQQKAKKSLTGKNSKKVMHSILKNTNEKPDWKDIKNYYQKKSTDPSDENENTGPNEVGNVQ